VTGRPRWWARTAVDVATELIAPGPVRDRYRQELEAELWDAPAGRQAGQALSMVVGAPALHRALVDSGVLAFPHSVWWCRLRLHHQWHIQSTEDGARFERCAACGMDNDDTMCTPVASGGGISAHGLIPG